MDAPDEPLQPTPPRVGGADGAQLPARGAADGAPGGSALQAAGSSAFPVREARETAPQPRADSAVRARRSWRALRCARACLCFGSRLRASCNDSTKVAPRSSHA
jgi:hypothetical protein